MIVDPEQRVEDNDEPFFSFELAGDGPLLVFDAGTEENVKDRIYRENTPDDIMIPEIVVRNQNSEEFINIQEGMTHHPELKDQKLKCLIIPIRYTKVFKS